MEKHLEEIEKLNDVIKGKDEHISQLDEKIQQLTT